MWNMWWNCGDLLKLVSYWVYFFKLLFIFIIKLVFYNLIFSVFVNDGVFKKYCLLCVFLVYDILLWNIYCGI